MSINLNRDTNVGKERDECITYEILRSPNASKLRFDRYIRNVREFRNEQFTNAYGIGRRVNDYLRRILGLNT